MRAKVVGVLALGWSLACSGLEIPGVVEAPPPDPVVTELIEAEQGEDPALEGDALTARQAALGTFLTATADFADWKAATIDCLHGECAETTEAAYARVKTDYTPQPAVTVAETGDPWRVLVIVEHGYFASEDWNHFSDEMETALPADQVAVVRAGTGVYGVSVTKDGAEVAAIDLKPFVPERTPKVGYVVAQEGGEPKWVDHGMVPDVKKAACGHFAIECPDAGGDEPADPDAGEGGPGKAKTKVKAKAKMKAKAGAP